MDQGAHIESVPQQGLVGYEVFRRFVARIDYEHGSSSPALGYLVNPARRGPGRNCGRRTGGGDGSRR